jgi:hypothetical protein
LKLSKKEFSLFFGTSFRITIPSLKDVDQLRSISGALLNVSNGELSPSTVKFAAEETTGS